MISYSILFYLLGRFTIQYFTSSKSVEKNTEPSVESDPKPESKSDLLRKEIEQLKIDAEMVSYSINCYKLNTPDTFAKHSKIKRHITKKESEYKSMKEVIKQL